MLPAALCKRWLRFVLFGLGLAEGGGPDGRNKGRLCFNQDGHCPLLQE